MNAEVSVKGILAYAMIPALSLCLVSCSTYGPTKEKGPEDTIAYLVPIESSTPGARIEANNAVIGITPCTLKVFADRDGTFHNFGREEYIVRAFPAPLSTNQFLQTRVFRTGGQFLPPDRIPSRIHFDMTQESGSFSTDLPPRQ